MDKTTIKVRIKQLSAETMEFEIPIQEEMSVLNVLEYIHYEMDVPVPFFSFCRRGLCGGCVVKIKGRKRLACRTVPKDEMEIEPVVPSITTAS